MENKKKSLFAVRLAYAAVCLALALVLPLLTANIREFGNALCPMHIPVLLCGFLCGWPWGLVVGAVAPVLRSVIFGMPSVFPEAVGMALELATYGFVSGLLYRLLPRKLPYLYVSLIAAMVSGRLVWGAARYLLAGLTNTTFPFEVFLAGALTTAVPGILLQIVIVPFILLALEKEKLVPGE